MKWSFAAIDKFIILTFALVVLLAKPTWNSLVGPDILNVATAAEVSTSTISKRGPASISTETHTQSIPNSFENTLDLHCQQSLENIRLQVRGDYIQLQGQNCWKNKAVNAIEIENTTNGYSASVFQQSAAKYKTDLIQLQPGLNELKVRYRAVSGQLLEQSISVLAN